MFDHDLATGLSEAERDEYRLAERDISDLTKDAVRLMFEVRPPAVVCITTAALLNSISADGIFCVRCPNPLLPFLFVDVPGESTKSLSGSHSNSAEAEVCRQIVTSLLRENVSPALIAIIVFYKEQCRTLAYFASTSSVDLHTVDSVQGREKNIVILLTTRTKFDPSRGEFLNDPHRLNVALSRCRHGQFVLGHEKSLAGLSFWADILQWANNRRAVTTAAALPDLLE
ncbi:hypothetical protein V3C99_018102 [Haemonchus contortus]|uniref:AAA_12 domain-containing protein n=1 Tax=Haemonchus contortus TaxID=6289 RepID=A0A7I4Z3U3_HAECO